MSTGKIRKNRFITASWAKESGASNLVDIVSWRLVLRITSKVTMYKNYLHRMHSESWGTRWRSVMQPSLETAFSDTLFKTELVPGWLQARSWNNFLGPTWFSYKHHLRFTSFKRLVSLTERRREVGNFCTALSLNGDSCIWTTGSLKQSLLPW